MVVGIALGHFYPDAGVRMEPLGDAFIKAIRVLIAPIIFCTVVHGIAGMADMAKVGRVALKALIYFEVLTTLALVLGLVAVNVFAPGALLRHLPDLHCRRAVADRAFYRRQPIPLHSLYPRSQVDRACHDSVGNM